MWHASDLPAGVGAVVLPGGFSYGDYLRCGAIARFAPVMEDVVRFAADGGPVLGICNGFQILCEAGLLPGVLRLNRQLEFVCRDVTVVVEQTDSPYTPGCAIGDELVVPVKHGEGNWFADDALYAELEERGQIVLRYVEDVNGARGRVAGVVNAGAQRDGADAAPRARRRSAARPDRRAADPRGPRRGSPRTRARLGLRVASRDVMS